MSDLQSLVDALAGELGRPVGLDDRQFRSLAYSSHDEEPDEVRLSSILHRQAPREVVEYLTSLDLERTGSHRRIPANPAIGMVARVCVPVRFADTLLGYVWLFDEPTPLTDSELDLARHIGDEAAAVLYRQRHLESADRERERALLGRLLGLDPGDPEAAAHDLLDSGLLAPSAAVHVAVLQADSAAPPGDDGVRVRLAAVADRLRRSTTPHHVLALMAGDAVVLLLAVDDDATLQRKLDALLGFAGEAELTPVVGVSAGRAAPADAAAAHDEAATAVRVAAIEPALRPVARWDDLGAMRTIAGLVGAADPAPHVPASFRALLDAPDADVLVPTLVTWLDNAGDAKHTAEALFVHRSSLYHRLHRIEAVAGVSLRSGDARLELHLGARLWQLAGGRLDAP